MSKGTQLFSESPTRKELRPLFLPRVRKPIEHISEKAASRRVACCVESGRFGRRAREVFASELIVIWDASLSASVVVLSDQRPRTGPITWCMRCATWA